MLHSIGFGLVDASILAIAALGFSLQFGVTNYVNFAYGAYLSFGAYMAVWSNSGPLHLSIWLSMVVAAVTTGMFSWVVDRGFLAPFIRRRSGLIFALIITFTLSLVLDDVYIVIWGTTFRELNYSAPHTMSVGPFLWSQYDVIFMACSILLLIAMMALLGRTRLGRMMRAMGDDLDLARVCGFRTRRVTSAVAVISGALAGLAGVMLAIEQHTFTTSIGDNVLFLILGSVILGGIGRPAGAVLGAILVGVSVQVAVLFIPAGLAPVLVFVALIAVMLLRPEGLLGATTRPAGQL